MKLREFANLGGFRAIFAQYEFTYNAAGRSKTTVCVFCQPSATRSKYDNVYVHNVDIGMQLSNQNASVGTTLIELLFIWLDLRTYWQKYYEYVV